MRDRRSLLAERRTLSFPDRKIVMGSTPVFEETSHVLRAYAQSDQRVFEVPCPECGGFHEIMWPQIILATGRAAEGGMGCPGCGSVIEEKHKADGGARPLAGHRARGGGARGIQVERAGEPSCKRFMGQAGAEFVAAKDDPTTLQTFVNTILGPGLAR